MDRRQFANECEGCRQNGVECRLWNEGICHEQNYYEEEVSVGAKNTEQQVQPDIGDAPAILDNTVELDGVLYRV